MTASIRADLTLGTVYGLAVSAVVWAMLLFPPAADAGDLLLLAVGAAAGAVATAFRRRLRFAPAYAVAVTALLLSGPALSCLAGAVCVLSARIHIAGGPGRRLLSRSGFRASRETLALGAAGAAFTLLGGSPGASDLLVPLAAHAVLYASVHALLVGCVKLGVGGRAGARARLRSVFVALPGCATGAAVGWAASVAFAHTGSRPLLLAIGALLATWAVHRLRLDRVATLRRHGASLGALRRQMTRALARMMEERDPRTQDHVRRVHRLCLGIGKRFDLSEPELETLGSAALLHDIGKVAIPESILTKPGRLTPEEMNRIKRHPVIGSEIVQALPFRRSLAPIIRYHHERWDGAGYPDGLAGEEIPRGARILSVVDCYDALTTDRPYRGALSHREAAAFMERESHHMFDPEIVDALLDYLEAREPYTIETPEIEDDQAIEPPEEERSFAGTLAAAQRELETLYDISRAAGYGLNLDEVVTLAGCRLSAVLPYQSLVVYLLDDEARLLRARYALGRAADKLRLMTIPLGERLSGWAAAQHRAVIGRDHVTPVERDGSRSDLEDWADDPEVASLEATLAAPMIGESGQVGVLTLYDRIDRGFTTDDRRILMRVAGCLAQALSREEREPTVVRTSLTDPLTGVPNGRFLWLESAHRMSQQDAVFGLIAFRVGGLERVERGNANESIDRMLCEVARRFAADCRRSETLVRFGQDLFVVLTPIHDSGELIDRWHGLADEVERHPLVDSEGAAHRARLRAAHASYPDDGEGLDALLEVLDARLAQAASRGRTVIPFRPRQPASVASDRPG